MILAVCPRELAEYLSGLLYACEVSLNFTHFGSPIHRVPFTQFVVKQPMYHLENSRDVARLNACRSDGVLFMSFSFRVGLSSRGDAGHSDQFQETASRS